MALTKVAVYRVTSRPNLFLGGDRELVMFTGVISAALIFALQTFSTIVVGVLFWMFAVFALRLMAKYDPHLRRIYLRDIQYQKYYAADSSPSYANSNLQESFYRNPDTIYH
jgi:type IV secretion system protein VirB3